MSQRNLVRQNQTGNVMAILLFILVVAFVVWVGFYIKDHRNTSSTSNTTPSAQKSSGSTTLSSGTDNKSLNSDLQTINTGLNQGDQNLQNSNNSLNDQQLPIAE